MNLRKTIGPVNIHKGLLLTVATALTLLFLYEQHLPLPLTDGLVGQDFTDTWSQRLGRRRDERWQQCRRVLQMGETQFSWEQDGGRSRCRRRQWPVADLQLGLRRLAELRGRSARLVFLGDSRVRIIYEILAQKLQLKPHDSSNMTILYSEFFLPKKLQRAVPEYEGSREKLPGGCVELNLVNRVSSQCSRVAADDTLRSEFWWRPHINARFRERLDMLLADCAADRCPDVVVVDSGAWYAKMGGNFPGDSSVARTRLFIEESAALRDRIARLAASTRVIWKLDEQFMPEAVWRRKENVTRMMMVYSSVIYETAMHVPDLDIWSSGVVDSMQFYHEVCLPHRELLKKNGYNPVRHECMDPMHVGKTVRWRLAQTLFNVLLMNVTTPDSGLCCGS